jgi:hypothetical protein
MVVERIEIEPATKEFNSSVGYHLWARHYYQCVQGFQHQRRHRFSPVPYALLCRAIELELKARLLEINPREDVRKKYRHKILKAYHALPAEQQILNEDEVEVLRQASELYAARDKHFDYPPPRHVLQRYSNYPLQPALDAIAKKLLPDRRSRRPRRRAQAAAARGRPRPRP